VALFHIAIGQGDLVAGADVNAAGGLAGGDVGPGQQLALGAVGHRAGVAALADGEGLVEGAPGNRAAIAAGEADAAGSDVAHPVQAVAGLVRKDC